MTRTQSTRTSAWCLFVLAGMASPALAQNITYEIGPISFPDGFALGGQVTTDGTLGTLTGANLVSFELLVTNPITTSPISLLSSDYGPIPNGMIGGNNTATSTQLLLNDESAPGAFDPGFFVRDFSNVSIPECVECSANTGITVDLSLGFGSIGISDFDDFDPSLFPFTTLDLPFVLGVAVPEPSSALLAFAGLPLFARRRR
ncbi:MAG: hypothetical protein AAGB00_05285 [Planctomycetota bacterium]